MIDTKLAKSVRPQVVELLMSHRNATYREIGQLAGMSRQRVHQIAKRARLTKEENSRCYRKDVTVERVLELYHRNLLIKEIAQVLSCSKPTVTGRLRAAGISKSECYSRGIKYCF